MTMADDQNITILPKGRYWIDVSKDPKELGTFEGFLSAFKEFVHVEVTDDVADDQSYRPFYIFTTDKDLVWPEGIGRPTIAGPNIRSRADTVQRPDPEKDLLDELPTAGDIGKAAGTFVQTAAVVAGVGIIVLLFIASRRR